MSIIKVVPLWAGRMYSGDDKLSRQYKRRYLIVTDNRNYDGLAVKIEAQSLGLLPRVFDPYLTLFSFDTGSLCRKVTITQDERHPRVWTADIEYSSTVRDQSRQDQNPTLRPIDIAWRSVSFQRAYEAAFSKSFSNFPDQEITGDSGGEELDVPVMNSAEDLFVPPLTDDDEILVIHIGKNIPYYDVNIGYDYMGSCNSQPWLGGQPETWKCVVLDGTLQPIENGIVYWRLEAEFHYKYDDWRKKVQDRGRNELIDGKKRLIVDRANNVLNGERLLNGSGKVLAAGLKPVFINYRTKRLRDFDKLKLF